MLFAFYAPFCGKIHYLPSHCGPTATGWKMPANVLLYAPLTEARANNYHI